MMGRMGRGMIMPTVLVYPALLYEVFANDAIYSRPTGPRAASFSHGSTRMDPALARNKMLPQFRGGGITKDRRVSASSHAIKGPSTVGTFKKEIEAPGNKTDGIKGIKSPVMKKAKPSTTV